MSKLNKAQQEELNARLKAAADEKGDKLTDDEKESIAAIYNKELDGAAAREASHKKAGPDPMMPSEKPNLAPKP